MKTKHPLLIVLALVGLCLGGCGDPNSFEDSLEIIKKRANAEDPYYMAAYAEVLRRGEYGVTIDKDAALEWAKKSSAKEHPLGLYNLWAIEEDDSIIPEFREGLKELAANEKPTCADPPW
jgi:TPR repeat protein